MLWLSKERKPEIIEKEIAIHDQNREYTPAFKTLLKDYYLDV
jgi:tRNA1(Val) A37 N6-methylase TrmN6